MQWALVNTVSMEYKNMVFENNEWIDKSYIAEPGTIIDIIVYDGESDYSPPTDLVLTQVPDTAMRGDTGY